MSKKKNLSPTASLATCLDFAARVLSCSLGIQQVCSKPVLASIVVNAHRYGQQVMKLKAVAFDAPMDVRQLLNMLQRDKVTPTWMQQSPLNNLKVADLSWDFQGNVADTLEMELMELETRASDTCVILSTVSHRFGTAQVVVWFSMNKLRPKEEEEEEEARTRPILVYICPGRVKLVKSVSDLMIKLYSELPPLGDPEATYHVWAVGLKLPSNNQEEKGVIATSSPLKPISLPFSVGTTGPESVRSVSMEMEVPRPWEKTNLKAVDTSFEAAHIQEEAGVEPEDNVTSCTRCSYEAAGESIFSFGRCQQTVSRLENRSSKLGGERDAVKMVVKAEEDTSWRDADDKTKSTGPTACHPTIRLKKSPITSTSLPELVYFAHKSRLQDNVGSSSQVHLQSDLRWQSCDGKVIRILGFPQELTSQFDKSEEDHDVEKVSLNTNESLSTISNDSEDDVNGNEPNEDTVQACDTQIEANQDDDRQEMESCSMQRNQSSTTASLFTFQSDESYDEIKAQGRVNSLIKCADSPTCLMPNTEATAFLAYEDKKNAVVNDVGQFDLLIHDEKHSTEVRSPECLDLEKPSGKESTAQQATSRPVNYKDKLGARIWWELEYTARKLEREEMMERQQQTQGKRAQRSTAKHVKMSRKAEIIQENTDKTQEKNQSRERQENDTDNQTEDTCCSLESDNKNHVVNPESASREGKEAVAKSQRLEEGASFDAADNQDDNDQVVKQTTQWGKKPYKQNDVASMLTTVVSDEKLLQTTKALVPFSLQGKVPIKTRDKTTISAALEASRGKDYPRTDDEQLTTSGSVAALQPPAASFIYLGETFSTTDSAMDKLEQLRQKKLKKLQETREVSVHQQQPERQLPRPRHALGSCKKASNRQLMQNALEFTLLAGGSMRKERTLALQALADSRANNFIVLFKSAKELKFRALYENHVDRDLAMRIFSILPRNAAQAPLQLESSACISQFFKYSSAKKQFLAVSTRSFTVKTDACALANQFGAKSRPRIGAIARLL